MVANRRDKSIERCVFCVFIAFFHSAKFFALITFNLDGKYITPIKCNFFCRTVVDLVEARETLGFLNVYNLYQMKADVQ